MPRKFWIKAISILIVVQIFLFAIFYRIFIYKPLTQIQEIDYSYLIAEEDIVNDYSVFSIYQLLETGEIIFGIRSFAKNNENYILAINPETFTSKIIKFEETERHQKPNMEFDETNIYKILYDKKLYEPKDFKVFEFKKYKNTNKPVGVLVSFEEIKKHSNKIIEYGLNNKNIKWIIKWENENDILEAEKLLIELKQTPSVFSYNKNQNLNKVFLVNIAI